MQGKDWGSGKSRLNPSKNSFKIDGDPVHILNLKAVSLKQSSPSARGT